MISIKPVNRITSFARVVDKKNKNPIPFKENGA